MKINRRKFFKSVAIGAGALGVLTGKSGLIGDALAAAAHDSKINRQGYSSSGTPAAKDKKKYDAHLKKVVAVKADAKPHCTNCKQYKAADKVHKGYGKCAMVGATAKPGKFVSEKGWCKVWVINKKKLA